VVGVVRDELKLAAPGIEIRFTLDASCGIGNHRSRLEMVREIIKDTVNAFARDALAVEENIFVRQVSTQVIDNDARKSVNACDSAEGGERR
jgi:hypothetical protein